MHCSTGGDTVTDDQGAGVSTAERPGIAAGAAGGKHGEYAELTRRIRAAGLLTPQPRYYLAKCAVAFLCLAAVLWGFWTFRSVGAQILLALVFAVCSGQLAFLFHEIGHRQMFATAGRNAILGVIIGNFLTGISYGWWVKKHNEHHANPNHDDLDPDVDIPLLAFSAEQAAEKRGIYRFVARYQAFFLLPLLSLVAYGQHYESLKFVTRPSRYRRWEIVALVGFVAWYLVLPTIVLGPWSTLLIVLIHHAAAGIYVGSVFAPNHKGMPMLHGDEALDPLRRQILTSRNIRAHPVTDFLYGGLNFQVEHHLFPSMARNRLRAAQPIVVAFCRERDILYHETSMLGSYREILQHLHELGTPLRAGRRAVPETGD
jgi:fatty acid desaturase